MFAALYTSADQPGILLAAGMLLVFANVFLVERRGGGGKLDPKRHLELSTLLESMPEALFIFDESGRIVNVNQAAEHLCARNREQLRSMDAAALARHLDPHQDQRPLDFPLLAVTRGLRGEPVRDERRMLRQPETGLPMEVLISANPIRVPDGSQIGVLVIVRDVTELSQLQRRISDVERHNAIGQMAAGIAHDFNNVLDTIIQAVAILEMDQDKPAAERRAYLEMIKNAVRRGAEIINQVRDYLRRGTGQRVEVDLAQLLTEVIDLTRPLWQTSPHIRLVRELKPVGVVRANPADLRRVFTNLIINAIEAMPQGGELTIGCDEQGGMVNAYVGDSGYGIAPDQQKKIFYPYYTTKPGGTGLGLSGAQRIVLAQGGRISFVSQPGQGTRFEVRLPLASRNQEMQRVA